MNRESVSTIAFTIKLIMLFFLINISTAQSDNIKGNFKINKAYGVNSLKDSNKGINQAAIKVKFIDKEDFYYLNTGEKKSFLREENTHFIIYKHKTVPSMTQDELQNRFIDDIDIIREHRLKKLVKFQIKKGKSRKDVISALHTAEPLIHFISPALTSKDKGGELAIVPNLIVSIDENVKQDFAMAELYKHGLSFVSKLPSTESEFEMTIDEPVDDISRIFEITRAVAELPFVRWAEPNFITSPRRYFTPDDPLFNNQWHLHNTGQSGAVVDADVDAPEGWDFSRGIDAVIAIYDGGIDLAHEDLNIWSNPGETGSGKETNGIDDDGNGYIDDYQGWDFTDDDNDPSPVDEPGPFGFKDNHGTAVAGVAGAMGNNSIGVTGSAQGAEILPVRMNSGTCSAFADAMRYAGKHADSVNNSWSIDACESNLNSAISDVVNGTITGARRGTKGTPVLFASGNNASGWVKFTLTEFPSGTFSFRWSFSKNASISSGYDTVWIDNINWPGGGITDFESETVGNIPTGFTSGGSATWAVVSDGIHARWASGKSIKAGTITHSQQTYLDITRAVGPGDLTFWAWISSEHDKDDSLIGDFFDLYVNGTLYFHYAPGQYGHDNAVGYPASNPDTIAVGASNDGGISGLEERSNYSQFGTALDVVAPSSGGGLGITTTDRSGNKGYDNSDYYSSFGGTSSATPSVAGIAAVIIAYNPALTSAEVRTILREGSDKIGPYAYSGGRNDFYGYGRVNLFNSLCPDSDGDGYTICANDCDDRNTAINPAAAEVCDNLDNDCDGSIDDNLTQATTCGVGECAGNTGTEMCTAGTWGGDTCEPLAGATAETCDNLDNDCDGSIDDNLTQATTCGVGECAGNTGTETCIAGTWGGDTCEPLAGATAEVCDNLDNNCDGSTDEGLQYQLTSSVNPLGAGSINPDCSGNCTYDCLDSAVLNAIEDSGYPFNTWTGCTSESNNICTVTMDDKKIATAEFDSCRYPARVLGAAITSYYSLLQDALSSAAVNDTVETRAYSFADDITFNNTATITLKAGYDCTYSTITGTTTVNGNVTINNGSIIIQSGTFEVR
jgi:subtilisin family serine protease